MVNIVDIRRHASHPKIFAIYIFFQHIVSGYISQPILSASMLWHIAPNYLMYDVLMNV